MSQQQTEEGDYYQGDGGQKSRQARRSRGGCRVSQNGQSSNLQDSHAWDVKVVETVMTTGMQLVG